MTLNNNDPDFKYKSMYTVSQKNRPLTRTPRDALSRTCGFAELAGVWLRAS